MIIANMSFHCSLSFFYFVVLVPLINLQKKRRRMSLQFLLGRYSYFQEGKREEKKSFKVANKMS